MRYRSWIGAVCSMFIVVWAQPVSASGAEPPPASAPSASETPIPDSPAGSTLKNVLRALAGDLEALTAESFSEPFLKAVPIDKFRALTKQIRDEHGDLVLTSINPGATASKLTAKLTGEKSKAAFELDVSVNDANRIDGLLIRPDATANIPRITSWADLNARMDKLAHRTAFGAYEIVIERPEPPATDDFRSLRAIHVKNEAMPLAIGSTFKLWILGALMQAVQDGTAKWEESLKLEQARKSLPSGVMQNLADGHQAPITEFATKMISISDNTATDHLLHRVGREHVEAFMEKFVAEPERNKPFLSTLEMFTIKLSGSDELPKAFLAADQAGRRAMLAPNAKIGSSKPQVILAGAWTAPRFIDTIEWFASPDDLAGTMSELDRMLELPGGETLGAVLSKNPGVALSKETFPFVGYKGGSEPGVLNLTWLLHRADGRHFVLTLGFNDTKKPINQNEAIGLASRVAEFLGAWDTKNTPVIER